MFAAFIQYCRNISSIKGTADFSGNISFRWYFIDIFDREIHIHFYYNVTMTYIKIAFEASELELPEESYH